MTNEARIAEAERVDIVYQYVLAQVGAQSITDALTLWQDVPTDMKAATAASWMERAIHLILSKRAIGRQLAVAYYRLICALRTGTTVQDPINRRPEPEHVSLERLRLEFDRLTRTIVPADPPPPADPEDTEVVEEEVAEAQEASDDEDEDLEPIDEDDAILLRELEELERLIEEDDATTEAYLEDLLDELGRANLAAKVEAINPDMTAGDARREMKLIHSDVGAQVAAASARVSMDGSRNLTFQIAKADSTVQGWIRQSTTGSPCYWCAMLISRGVMYKSQQSAGGNPTDANRFHDNCYCVAVPVFDVKDMTSSEAFALNRYYRDLWEKHIHGKHSGDTAINEWRKLLRRLRSPETSAAQEAAA